ncbi:SNARE domain protein [Cooperia oncophora]
MRDRLADFQQRVVTDRFEEVELGPTDVTAVPLASALDSRIIFLRRLLDELQSEIESLHRKQQHILSLAIADPKEKDVLEDQISKIRRKTFDLRKMVNEVDNEFSEFARVCPSQGEVRIRKNQIDLIRKKLRDVIIRFNETHADYRSRVSVRVRRQLRAVGENITEEEADKIINSAGRDEGRSEVTVRNALDKTLVLEHCAIRVRRQLRAVGENITEEEADKIINSAGRDELFFREVNPLSVSARAALTDVKRRHNEIVELEKSIQEMQEIFIDLQNLTEGDIVDNIERNVDTTKVHVEEGARKLKVGLEYKKSATRKKVSFAYISSK